MVPQHVAERMVPQNGEERVVPQHVEEQVQTAPQHVDEHAERMRVGVKRLARLCCRRQTETSNSSAFLFSLWIHRQCSPISSLFNIVTYHLNLLILAARRLLNA